MFLSFSSSWDPNAGAFRALNLAGSHPVLDAIMVGLTLVGTAYLLAILAVPLYARGHKEVAFDVLAAIVVTLVATELVRIALAVPRPCQVLSDARTVAFLGCPEDPAFPSGHASRAFGIAALLAFRLPARFGALGFVAAGLIGLSRVYLGVHWPADVLAGAALGIGLGLCVEVLARRSARYRAARKGTVALVDRALARARGR